MDQSAITQRLAKLQFTKDMSEPTRAALAGIAADRTLLEGDVVCREGQTSRELFMIESGHVALDIFVPGRGQVRILTLGPGEIVGWSSMVGNHGSTATGTATEKTRVIAFRDDDFLGLCQSNHDVGYPVMRELARSISRRLVATRLQLLDLFAPETP
ncbi:MAG: Crp/Fnr family transcriptional regulator [Planctomycetota bacterium]|jgi:CRP-like cAMP-binding protein